MSAWQDLQDQALEKVELAGVYLEDGAPRTAARLLRGAADKLDLAAKLREEALLALVGGEA